MGDDDSGLDLALIGVNVYGFASGGVTAVVLMDYLANLSVYTTSYLMGAPPFIILNLIGTVWFTRAVFRGELRWYGYIVPIVSYVLISWLFHGLNPFWRTAIMSSMVFLGILMVWASWRSQRR